MTLLIDLKPKLDDWKSPDNLKYWYISTVFCEYDITAFKGKFYVKWIILDPEGEEGYSRYLDPLCKSLEEAKAVAQADYERRTAERFKPIEIPKPWKDGGYEYQFVAGYDCALRDIAFAIAKATEIKS